MKIDTINIIRDWITSGAVVVGGLWALWKFGYSERRQRKKEMPAITGHANAKVVKSMGDNAFVDFRSRWKNHSPMPVTIDPEKISVEVYSIKVADKPGFMNIPDELDKPEHSSCPFQGYRELVLEPGTDSVFKAYATLERERVYLVRWTVTEKASNDPYFWDTESLLDLRSDPEEEAEKS
jgi:hypothetical protein